MGFLRVKWPNQQCQSTEGSSSPKDTLQSHQVHLTMLQYYTCMQYTVIQKIHTGTYTKMNLSTVKWAQWDKTQSRELLGLFICVCIALCTIVAHNIAQNRPDNFSSYPPDNYHCSNDVYLREGGPHEDEHLTYASCFHYLLSQPRMHKLSHKCIGMMQTFCVRFSQYAWTHMSNAPLSPPPFSRFPGVVSRFRLDFLHPFWNIKFGINVTVFLTGVYRSNQTNFQKISRRFPGDSVTNS